MQHTPIVELPEQHPHRDWGVIVAAVAIILIAVLATVMLIQPNFLSTTPELDHSTNPELSQFELFQAERAAQLADHYANPELTQFRWFAAERAAAQPVAGPQNPELSAAYRFEDLQSEAQMLRENPEVRQALRWLENR